MTRGYLPLLLTLAAIWGASFMFIEVALDDLAPTTLMLARLALAAAVLALIMVARRGFARTVADVRAAGLGAFGIGVINSALPFTLIAWGQTRIDSGVAAIANASVPIWVALLALRFRDSERSSGSRLVGSVLGLVGVGVLVGVQPEASWAAAVGTLAVVAASFAYGVGSLLAQSRMEETSPLALSLASTLGATLALLPFGLAQMPSELPGAKALASVTALGVAGTAIGMVMFFRIIDRYGSARASLVTYLLPVTALAYGALLLGEAITPEMLVGLALILTGVALGSGTVRLPRRDVVPAAPRA